MANEDKSARYHRLRRRASALATLSSGLLLIVLLVSGAAVALRVVINHVTGSTFLLSASLYAVVLVVVSELVVLPLAFYQGMTLEKRYGLATQTASGWLWDRGKTVVLASALAVMATLLIELSIRWSPGWWWLLATAAFSVLLVLLAHFAPVMLMPLFYTFRALDRPALSDRLLGLARRAGTQVLGVFEWRLSDRTRKANAALAGIGSTRRILLSDTLLADHSDEEIEVILAHELAHHVHRDIWSGLALESVLIGVALFSADRLLVATSGWFGLTGKDDIAALPLLVLAAGAASLCLVPVTNALSRAHERRADRYALEMTRNPSAFISAMKRLSAQNLAEEEPSRIVEWLFHSHPPTRARIAAATAWKAPTST